MKPRDRALEILLAIDRGRVHHRGAGQSADQRLIDSLVAGVLRNRALLDHMIREVSGRELNRIDPVVLEGLRLGFHQIAHMRIPSHAAVSETVDVVGRRQPRARGFVNAILRNATRTDLETLIPRGNSLQDVAIRVSHPLWLLERWAERYGRERAIAIAEANQQPSTPDILINRKRISIGDAHRLLDEREIAWRASDLLEEMVRIEEGNTRSVADEIARGLFHPMDEGSAVVALAASRGTTVLDLAAAPGGKSFFLRGRGIVVTSTDVDFARARVLQASASRLFEESHRIAVVDALRPAFLEAHDTVLLDAPCSASGIIRKHPEIRWRLTPELIRSFGDRQIEMAENAASLSRSHLIYSTCSIEPEENDHVIRSLLDRRPDLELVDPRRDLDEAFHDRVDRMAIRLLPDQGTDGFSIFILEKSRKRP